MAQASLGDIDVDLLHVHAPLLKDRVDVWEVAGVDGYGAQTLGKGEADFSFVTVDYAYGNGSFAANNTAADGIISAYADLVGGEALTLTDSFGTVTDNVLIRKCDDRWSPEVKKAVIFAGDAGAIRVELHWNAVVLSAAESSGGDE